MEAEDRIAFLKIEFMGFAVLDVGVELNGIAFVLYCPVLDAGEEIFPYAFGAEVRIDDDIVDFQLFPRIEADRYPAI